VTGYRRSAYCPRRRVVALSHSRTLCAPAGIAPITVSRWSKICPIERPRHNIRAKRRCVTGCRRSAYCPRRRVVALPHSRILCAPAGTAPSPLLDGPKSAPSSARATTWVQASVCDWIPKVGILPAPSRRRPLTLSHTVRASRHSPHHRFSMVQNLSHRTPLSTYVPSVGVAGYRRSANCPRRRAIALGWTPPVRAVRVA